jgi:hypothetical protein
MVLIQQKRKRRSIRLKEYDYSNPWWYYITICTHNHQSAFGNFLNGKIVLNEFGKIVEGGMEQNKGDT